jgi:hypothetical protein
VEFLVQFVWVLMSTDQNAILRFLTIASMLSTSLTRHPNLSAVAVEREPCSLLCCTHLPGPELQRLIPPSAGNLHKHPMRVLLHLTQYPDQTCSYQVCQGAGPSSLMNSIFAWQ